LATPQTSAEMFITANNLSLALPDPNFVVDKPVAKNVNTEKFHLRM
jgi:hypothetical protein